MSTRDAVEFRIDVNNLRVEGEECLYLLPQGFVDAILSLDERLKWKATWIDSDGSRASLTDAEMQIVELGLTRLCNPMDIVNNIDVSCGGSGGCGGGCGCDNTTVFPNPFPNTNPTIPPSGVPVDDGVNFPEEFNDYNEYRDYKCRVATQMVDDFTESIGNLQTLGGLVAVGAGYALASLGSAAVYQGVVVGLAAIGLSTGLGVVIIAGVLGGLVYAGASIFSYFDDIFDELVANRTDFICGVFNARNEAEARQVFYDIASVSVVNAVAETDVRSTLQNTVNGVIDALVPSEVVLMLFQFFADVGKEAFDCASCPSVPSGLAHQFVVESCVNVQSNGFTFAYNNMRLIDGGTDCHGTAAWDSFYSAQSITGDGLRASSNQAQLTPSTNGLLQGLTLSFDVYELASGNSDVQVEWLDEFGGLLSTENQTLANGATFSEVIPTDAWRYRITIDQNTALVNIDVS